MPPPFHRLDLDGFRVLLGEWQRTGRRRATEVHMHHTWRPNHAQYSGENSIVAMWRYHTQENGWSDIAQHVTIAPDGAIWTGRHWDMPPASALGHNGSSTGGPFMFEMIGDFDTGRDPFGGAQRDAVLAVVALVQDSFGLPLESLRFHNMLGSPKTCPGSSISYAEVSNAVRALRGQRMAIPRGAASRVSAARSWLKAEPPAGLDADFANQEDGHGQAAAATRATGASRATGRLEAAALAALRPHVIDLWGGQLSSGGVYKTDEADIDRIFDEFLPRHLDGLGEGAILPIVLYAHGGLVDEESGLRTAASQVPWWLANGCYPLQFVWETGLFEEIARLIGIQRAAARGVSDLTDAIVEAAARNLGGPQIWGGMKHAASSAFEVGAAGTRFAERLVAFVRAHGERVRLHGVGHSAGAIFQAYLLRRLDLLDAPPLETLTFLAPAITVADYLRLIDPLVPQRARRLRLFTMAKDFELADTVTFAYRKSLLYMIYYALEPSPKEPVLGLEVSLRADPRMVARFGLAGTASATGEAIWSRTAATTGAHASRSATHGGFDNDVPTMESTARGILGRADDQPLPQPFPPDAESRSPQSRAIAAVQIPAGATTMPSSNATGNRRALCVGINDYPNPQARLQGCVADAMGWEAALAGMGFTVGRLHNGAATRAGILRALEDLLVQSRAGDVLAFQYSGHGTTVPDLDGDESTDEDQAICPVDYEDGNLLIDDDIRAVLEALPAGVHLTCFMDNCFSYTNTRFVVGRAAPANPRSLKRVVTLTPEIVDRYRAVRARGGTRGTGVGAPGAPEDMRWIAFAACKSDEVAYETDGSGDFSRVAVPLLGGSLTNRQFRDKVIDALGAQPRQHPMLDCRREEGDAPLFAFAADRGRADLLPVAAPQADGLPAGSRADAVADLLTAVARVIRAT